jgi:hypothetical protein
MASLNGIDVHIAQHAEQQGPQDRAFTQVGCKYKHEMPTDKATQLSLGLSHGFPNWYRRAHDSTRLNLLNNKAPNLVRSRLGFGP